MSSAALADHIFDIVSTTRVSREQVADNLVAALEGGSTFWGEDVSVPDYLGFNWAHEAIAAGAPFEVLTDDGSHEVPTDRVERGLQLMAEVYPHHFGNLAGNRGDAETGDILFQLICFGEVVYG